MDDKLFVRFEGNDVANTAGNLSLLEATCYSIFYIVCIFRKQTLGLNQHLIPIL